MIDPTDAARSPSIVVLQHWDGELQRLLSQK